LGIVAATPFLGAEAMGRSVDDALRLVGSSARATRFGTAYRLFALAIFCSLSGPRILLAALAESYLTLPVGGALEGGAQAVIAAAAQLVVAGVGLAAPILATLLLVDLAAGLLERAQPALGGVVALPAVRVVAAVTMAALLAVTTARGLSAVVSGSALSA